MKGSVYGVKWLGVNHTFYFIKRAYLWQLLLKLRKESWVCTEAFDV